AREGKAEDEDARREHDGTLEHLGPYARYDAAHERIDGDHGECNEECPREPDLEHAREDYRGCQDLAAEVRENAQEYAHGDGKAGRLAAEALVHRVRNREHFGAGVGLQLAADEQEGERNPETA